MALAMAYRAITVPILLKALRGTVAISGMILFIIVGATTFSQVLSFSGATNGIVGLVSAQGLSATGLTVTFDGASSTVSVFGVAPDQATKEKIVLCCGNVSGVAKVNDMMSVDQSAPEAKYYTVVSGDTLSKISKQFYGDANKYMKIFEANKPMLSNPDKIYPGQLLRIPPK